MYGLLAFSNVSAILDLVDVNDESSGRRLRHDYFALDRLERWGTIAFHVSYGEWIRSRLEGPSWAMRYLALSYRRSMPPGEAVEHNRANGRDMDE
jgi:hypothetical protein